jgi:putative transcriptional regulator
MAKPNRNLGEEILAGIREIKRGEHGRVAKVPAVADVRAETGLSQSEFARLMGVSVRTLQEWEQGRRAPSGAARTLILIAARNPASLAEVALRAT